MCATAEDSFADETDEESDAGGFQENAVNSRADSETSVLMGNRVLAEGTNLNLFQEQHPSRTSPLLTRPCLFKVLLPLNTTALRTMISAQESLEGKPQPNHSTLGLLQSSPDILNAGFDDVILSATLLYLLLAICTSISAVCLISSRIQNQST
ncbi:hypothetical protein STEG23_029083, partial [Scotinomys teguina]